MDVKLWAAVGDHFNRKDIGSAVAMLEAKLRALRPKRFGALLDADFTNRPADLLQSINEFIRACDAKFKTAAVYLEMNGFDLNPGRWYFDSFGYNHYEADDLEWLCDWHSDDWTSLTLEGLEAVQRDFEWYHSKEVYNDESFDQSIYETAQLLVMAKFVRLAQAAVGAGELVRKVPVLATAHEFDIVGRFEPPAVTAVKPLVRRRK